jgi:hypothetical protein
VNVLPAKKVNFGHTVFARYTQAGVGRLRLSGGLAGCGPVRPKHFFGHPDRSGILLPRSGRINAKRFA